MEVRGRVRYCGFVVVDGVPGVLTACAHELRGLYVSNVQGQEVDAEGA